MSAAHAHAHVMPAQVVTFARGQPPSMAVSARDLEERLAQASPGETVKGVLCNAALSAVQSVLDRNAADTCRAASGERRFIDFFHYSISSFLRLSFTAAELSRSKLGGYDAAFRTLGKQAVDDFLSTAVGKTLRSLGNKDPHRLLATLPSAYRTALNHGERSIQLAGAGRCVLRMRRDFLPHPYHEGVLLALLSSLGLGPVQVIGRRVGVLDADYEITWD
ncbi:MAG TPA: TIGR02265 family protein [Myxococcales bacterium]|nr:TIGR02265 family protein [Myxococcales bacterium]